MSGLRNKHLLGGLVLKNNNNNSALPGLFLNKDHNSKQVYVYGQKNRTVQNRWSTGPFCEGPKPQFCNLICRADQDCRIEKRPLGDQRNDGIFLKMTQFIVKAILS